MIDLLYLAHNRLEFTRRTFEALVINTDWSKVRSFHVFDDASTDGTREWLDSQSVAFPAHLHCGQWGSPVAIMNEFLATVQPEVFVKVDNDTMLPPAWLTECLKVLDQNPTVDLVGLEAFHPVEMRAIRRYAEPAEHIGGIGVMRGRAFQYGLPRPDGRFGFTAWQAHEDHVKKAWINPALPVCLLDRMPMEPFVSLSKEYVGKGWQRPWEEYTEEKRALWGWFQ